jgi:hypothetical protein
MASVVQALKRPPGFRAFNPGYVLTLSLMILGRTVTQSAAASEAPAPANNSPKHPGVACPSLQFKAFLEAFTENGEVHQAFIRLTLQ